MGRFPFFKLPLLTQKKTIQQMGYSEIMKFSLLSQRALHFAQVLGHFTISESRVFFHETWLRVELYWTSRSVSFTFEIVQSPGEGSDACKTCEWTGFNGQQVEEHKDTWYRHFTYAVIPSGEFFTAAREILKTLSGSFRNSQIFLDFVPNDSVLLLIDSYFRGCSISNALVASTQGKPTPSRQFHGVLTNLNITEQLYIPVVFEEGVQYGTGFTAPKVEIKHPHWIHVNSILNSTTAYFRFAAGPYPTKEMLKSILNDWVLNQRMRNLIKISWKHPENRRSEGVGTWPDGLEEVIRGLGEAAVDYSSLSAEEKAVKNEEKSGKFIRRVDRKLAVVAMDEDAFYFRVM